MIFTNIYSSGRCEYSWEGWPVSFAGRFSFFFSFLIIIIYYYHCHIINIFNIKILKRTKSELYKKVFGWKWKNKIRITTKTVFYPKFNTLDRTPPQRGRRVKPVCRASTRSVKLNITQYHASSRLVWDPTACHDKSYHPKCKSSNTGLSLLSLSLTKFTLLCFLLCDSPHCQGRNEEQSMNGQRDENPSSCHFHPDVAFVGVCPLCLNERLVVLAAKQSHPRRSVSGHAFRAHHHHPSVDSSKKPPLNIPKIFAIGTLFNRLEFRQWRADSLDDAHEASSSPEGKYLCSGSDCFFICSIRSVPTSL